LAGGGDGVGWGEAKVKINMSKKMDDRFRPLVFMIRAAHQ
jgi:hypothetical protein